ncbi:MAG: ketoacyl-ACP synthase III [Bacteroidota bacterium]|nr:ketoacyl-ACP synthase III [Bacteroidota bacterium]
MKSYIRAITSYLPEKIISNEDLDKLHPEWNIHELAKITGVMQRHVAGENDLASDYAFTVAEQLFDESGISRNEIDFVLFNSYSPDYLSPNTACILQDKLGIPTHAGAIDFNVGCTGFVYGLSIANGLVVSGACKNVLFITADVTTKYLHPGDKSTWTLFGDGAAACIVSEKTKDDTGEINSFVLGSDGRGHKNIIIKNGGAKQPLRQMNAPDITDNYGNTVNDNCIKMNGSAVFLFSIKTAPKMIKQLLEKENLIPENIDRVVFHQASKYILQNIAKKTGFGSEQYRLDLEKVGNIVASSIPTALHHDIQEGKIKQGDTLLLASFGVGFSWAGTILKW